MRKLNDIETQIKLEIEYYETHKDYLDNYLETGILGDHLQYYGVNEDEITRLLSDDVELYAETDYSYMDDDAIAVFHVGEIEIQIETNLTKKEYDILEKKFEYSSRYTNGILSFFICTGMNIRIYENKNEGK